jgi:hypothetical protein
VYLGASGQLTQTPAASGFHLTVGRALTATKILVALEPPIILA